METVAQKAYRLLKDIPSNQWGIGIVDSNNRTCCLLGHYQRMTTNPDIYEYDFLEKGYRSELAVSGRNFLQKIHSIDHEVFSVNDSTNVNGYIEPEIKDRCMHLLQDMIKAGY